jgi:hypothetical protein
MRGGAIPLLAWATILLALFVGNWLWDQRAVNAAESALSALIIYAFGVALWLARRDSIRRGPPEAEAQTDAVPQHSLAAVLVGLSVATILFGVAWANFLVYFGAGALVLALGRLALELRSERRSRQALAGHEEPR